MFTAKSLLTLFAIAAGGFINSGIAPPVPATAEATPPVTLAPDQEYLAKANTSRVDDGETVPTDAVLQAAARDSLLAGIRKDFRDTGADIHLSRLSFKHSSGRSVEGKGQGIVSFDTTGSVPVDVTVLYDLPEARIEHADYVVGDSGKHSPRQTLNKQLRDAITDRICARLVLEFAQQPVDFSLLDISHVASGNNRILVSGIGITRFPGEGAASTRFTAIADKLSGRILNIDYELLQEVEPQPGS